VIDRPRAQRHQFVPRAQQAQVSLYLAAAMLDRAQELGVQTGEARQGLGVHAVRLAVALGDQLYLARIGHDDFVP
jgi:hypothetical protein